jgi:solute carrier family 8 (sodium/calcium exchanger)
LSESITMILAEKKIEEAIIEKDGTHVSIGVSIWNPRIANVTLLAIGSSAPEILLGILSTFSSRNTGNSHTAPPSTLAPMVMVGSASFNLLVVTAVAIVSVEKGVGKRIHHFKTFLVTLGFSSFAYFWMFLVLYVITPA